MKDMQRWGMEYERGEWDIAPDPEGAYVLLAEAKAAINAARRDMLAKCIVVSLVYDKGDVLATLRALQEVDTLKQEPIKHINFVDKSQGYWRVT